MKPVTRRTFLRTGLAAGIGAAAGTGAYGAVYERHHLAVTQTTVNLRSLPPALDGVRIGILTDLHHSRLVSQQDIANAVALVTAERPDVVALLGDYVTWGDKRYTEGCAEALAKLQAPHGVFAILGNHDDERVMPRALARRGIEVLTDERTNVSLRGESLALIGVKYWTRKASEIGRLVRGTQPSILLAHDPRRLTEAAGLGVSLVLSGHTHGGQIVLPLIGPVAAQKFPVAHGVTHLDGTVLFVSRGVGTVFVPIRLNCPPEVAIVTLRSAGFAD